MAGLIAQQLAPTEHPQEQNAEWVCNMPAIYRNLNKIFAYELYGQYRGSDVMLLLGGKSYHYDPTVFQPIFPNLQPDRVVIVPGAGHWVHAEKPRECINAIGDFLLDIDCARPSLTPAFPGA